MIFSKPLSELHWDRRRGSSVNVRKYSLQTFGQNYPVTIDKDGNVLDESGFVLCQAAKELGWQAVQVFLKVEIVVPCG